MTAAAPRVVLDSSILFSRVLHELFGRLALDAQLFAILWSDELLAETKRVLIERKPVDEPVAERWVRYLRDAFPEGRVTPPDEHPIDLATLTSDPDDEHVCALALASAPVTLITTDQGFNADALASLQVQVASADEFLAPLCDEQPDVFLAVAERQARAWRGRPLDELLDAYQRAGATRLARQLRRLSET
jgi:predicted nucleic acid-binding protein